MYRPRPRRRLSRLIAILAVAAVVAGCGSSSTPRPTSSATASSATASSATASETASTARPNPSGSAAATAGSTSSGTPSEADREVYSAIEKDVQRFRELTAKTTLEPTILDSNGVREYMTKAFDEQVDPKVMANTETLLKHMGMLSPKVSLLKLELDLQSSQIIGFYDTNTKKLYVVSESGQIGPTQKSTFAHEFTHALQDQNFGLDSLATDTADQGDRNLARTALVEGDATLAMTQWAQARLSIGDILQMTSEAATSEQQDLLLKSPPILTESLMFPYTGGLSFIQRVYNHGGWEAVDRIYKDPPASTSQILHPELYDQRVEPVKVSLPAIPGGLGSDWKLTFEDTFGEMQLGVWLAAGGGVDAKAAAAAAVSNWGGDRIGMYEGPGGKWAVVLRTVWRSADGQTAFLKGLATATHADGSEIRSCAIPDHGVDVVIGSDASALEIFTTCTPQG